MPKRLLSVLLLLTAGGAAVAEPLTLRLHGSNTIGATLAPALVEAWLGRWELRMYGVAGSLRRRCVSRDARPMAKRPRWTSMPTVPAPPSAGWRRARRISAWPHAR